MNKTRQGCFAFLILKYIFYFIKKSCIYIYIYIYINERIFFFFLVSLYNTKGLKKSNVLSNITIIVFVK